MGNSIMHPQKIKNRTTISSNKPTSGYLSKELKITIWKGCLHLHVHCSITTTAKIRKQSDCSMTDEWIRKIWHIDVYAEYHKKEGDLAILTAWMNLKGIMLSEIRPRKTSTV